MSSTFEGEFGVQFTLHIADNYTTPQIGKLGQMAYDNEFDQVWVNDNLGYRNVFVALSAIASKAPIKIGTAIMVPYLRNPIDVADTVAALSEMTQGQEVTIGIGRGAPMVNNQIKPRKPYRMMRETTQMLNQLLAGGEVKFGDYDLLTSYFNLQPEMEMQLAFTPQGPVQFHIGGYGETAMTVGGKFMDGTVIGGSALQLLKVGKLTDILENANEAATESDSAKELKHVVEINTSISDDPQAARDFAKPYMAHSFAGPGSRLSDDDLEKLGVDPQNIEQVQTAMEEGATPDEAADLVTDAMVESKFIVGTPEECIVQFKELMDDIVELGIDQISFAKLGPDYRKSMDLLSSEIIPMIS